MGPDLAGTNFALVRAPEQIAAKSRTCYPHCASAAKSPGPQASAAGPASRSSAGNIQSPPKASLWLQRPANFETRWLVPATTIDAPGRQRGNWQMPRAG
jgi:hypothetical protein